MPNPLAPSHEQLPLGATLNDVGVTSSHKADHVRLQERDKVEERKESDRGG